MKMSDPRLNRSTIHHRLARRGDRGGFTILEILIASAIMAVGMVMILGLFPFGIRVGKQVVEDTTGIAIARSVADSIRFGMRNNLRKTSVRDGTTFSYFVFQHDGVKDPVPLDQRAEDVSHDYHILLPIYPRGSSFEGGNEVAVSPDGTLVYAVASKSDTLARFSRDASLVAVAGTHNDRVRVLSTRDGSTLATLSSISSKSAHSSFGDSSGCVSDVPFTWVFSTSGSLRMRWEERAISTSSVSGGRG